MLQLPTAILQHTGDLQVSASSCRPSGVYHRLSRWKGRCASGLDAFHALPLFPAHFSTESTQVRCSTTLLQSSIADVPQEFCIKVSGVKSGLLTRWASASSLKGFIITCISWSRRPCAKTAFSAQPVMNRIFKCGRSVRAAAASWRPLRPFGRPTSVIVRSMSDSIATRGGQLHHRQLPPRPTAW